MTKPSHRVLAQQIEDADPVTDRSPHLCRSTRELSSLIVDVPQDHGARPWRPPGRCVAGHPQRSIRGLARLWCGRQNCRDADQSQHSDGSRRRCRLDRPPVRPDGQCRQHDGHGQDHHESGRRLPRCLPHRQQGESGHQHGPADLGVPAHPGPAGHPAHHLRAADRWFPDRRRVQQPGRVRWAAPVPALREPVGVAGRHGQPGADDPSIPVGLQRGHPEHLLGVADPRHRPFDHRRRVPLPPQLRPGPAGPRPVDQLHQLDRRRRHRLRRPRSPRPPPPRAGS